jgi:hypothetical protein
MITEGYNMHCATRSRRILTTITVLLAAACGSEARPDPDRYSYSPSGTTVCGNSSAEGSEVCDGSDLKGATCTSLGQGGGVLACAADCHSFATSGCDSACTPACGTRRCGPDPVCQTTCGTCTAGTCDVTGECVVADPDGPRVLSFDTNVTSLTAGESVKFTAVVTDPQGIDDLIGGSLLDPVTGNAYGVFSTGAQEGAYSLTVTWAEMNQVRAIDFTTSEGRAFLGRFNDQAGHATTIQKVITLTCGGKPACAGACGQSRCDGSCVDLQNDDANCGGCNSACMAGGTCELGGCVCQTDEEVECPVVGCVDLGGDSAHCGTCSRSCPADNYCYGGRCSCSDATDCAPGEVCSQYKYGSTIYHQCILPGDGYLSGSRTLMAGEVELAIDGEKVPVCSSFYSYKVGEIICRELHGAGATVVSTNSDYAVSANLGVFANCTGSETRLKDCVLQFDTYCVFDEGFFVTCGGAVCTPNCSGRTCGDDSCGGSCGTCTGTDVCGTNGVCGTGGVPATWTCLASYYNGADGCDCECGAYDPDCANPGQIYNCSADQTRCDAQGHCAS